MAEGENHDKLTIPPATATLAVGISTWYVIQVLSVILLGFTETEVYYWFYATASPAPSWLFAPFSHQLPPGIGHLLINLTGLLVFGSYAERHIGIIEFSLFTMLSAYITLFLQFPYADFMYLAPVSNAGMSGAIFALMAFTSFHLLRQHEADLSLSSASGTSRVMWRNVKWVFVTLGMLLILAQTVLQAIGYLPFGNSSVATHLSGLVIGILYEYVRPGVWEYTCG